jgi:hypothetical protein
MNQKSLAPSKHGRIERYKVAYIDPTNMTLMRSEMHKNVESAIAAGERESTPHLIMELRDSYDGHYTWEVMPHGFHQQWSMITGAYERRWQIGIGLAAGFLAGLILLAGNDKKTQYAPTFDSPE